MTATRPRSLSCPPPTATPQTAATPQTTARKVTRRAWLGYALIGAQVVALAACGGDDDNEEAEATARRADGAAGLRAEALKRIGSSDACRVSRRGSDAGGSPAVE